MAPRRQGTRVPSPRPQVASRVPPFAGRFLGRRPLCRSVGFWVAAPSFVPPLPGAGVTTDPVPMEVVSGAGSHEGCPPHGKRWCCFGSHTLPSRTVALLTQSYPAERGVGDADDPADFEETLLPLGLATSTSSSFGPRVRDDSGRSPRRRRTVAHRAPRVRDDSGRSPRSRRTVWHRARKAACPQIADSSAPSAGKWHFFPLSHRVL